MQAVGKKWRPFANIVVHLEYHPVYWALSCLQIHRAVWKATCIAMAVWATCRNMTWCAQIASKDLYLSCLPCRHKILSVGRKSVSSGCTSKEKRPKCLWLFFKKKKKKKKRHRQVSFSFHTHLLIAPLYSDVPLPVVMFTGFVNKTLEKVCKLDKKG